MMTIQTTSPAFRMLLHQCLSAIVFCLFSFPVATHATDGSTPVGYTAGAPAGTYSLSGFENINFFNGNLNFTLPLVQLQGRGSAGHAIVLRRENKWTMFHGPYYFYAHPNGWQNTQAGYGAGALEGRMAGVDPFAECWEGYEEERLLRLTFTAPDGTEYELHDKLTNGASGLTIYGQGCMLQSTQDRGRVFITSDGSAATFISDTNVDDVTGLDQPTGYLMLRDGTRFRISAGKVMWMRDRTGNMVTYEYTNNQVTRIEDSLKRAVTITYRQSGTSNPDTITYKGTNGVDRTIRVWYAPLDQALRSGYVPQTYRQLFPELNGTSTSNYYNSDVVSSIELPDGRRYWLRYNSYGELARVELPTGGAFEYDWEGGLTGGTASGVMLNYGSHIYRRVVERRVYDNGGSGSSYTSRTTISKPENATNGNLGYVLVEQRDSAATLLTKEVHYYHGSARDSFDTYALGYQKWKDGREWKAEVYASNGTTVLRRTEQIWQQPLYGNTWPLTQGETNDNAKSNDPQVTQILTTLVDSNQISKQTFSYDKYSNKTDVYEYDFGLGSAPPSWVRRTHTDYLTINPVNSIGYDTVNPTWTNPDSSATVHLRSLPTQSQVFDAGGAEKARTTFEYDNYVNDSLHAPLNSCPLISWLCDGSTQTCPNNPNFTSTGHTTRGNATKIGRWLNTTGATLNTYMQYDVAGNLTKSIDARGYATEFFFEDRFGSPDGDAQVNSAPTQLGGLKTYGFATRIKNALNQNSYTQFEYHLGRAVDAEEVNGVVSSAYSENDMLDRPTKVIRANNQAAAVKHRTLLAYDDVGKTVTTSSDLNTYADAAVVNKLLYDGLGRTIETRQYEGGANYIATQQQYDTLGRGYKTSNPFRPWQGETAVWTQSGFDALGRILTVTTPDNAVVNTSYSGNSVTVIDQAGKKRRSVTDGLGRLIRVDEPDANYNFDSGGSPIQPTNYSYDVLDNLIAVMHGEQTRTFVFDSLRRLISATNPETGTVTYSFDNNGNLINKLDARNITTTVAYDALSRVTSKSYNDNPQTPTVNYIYDSDPLPSGAPSFDRGWSTGRLVATNYGGGNAGTYRGYDQRGRVVRQYQRTDSVNYVVEAAYWANSALKDETYPSVPGASDRRLVSFVNDAAERLASLSSLATTYAPGASVSSIGYASHNGLKTETYGNSLVHAMTYNIRLQPNEIKLGTSGNPTSIVSITNNYGTTTNNGNIQSVSYAGGGLSYTQSFGYDQLNRLTTSQENAGASWSQTNGYDRYGNRWIDLGGGSQSLYFNASNNRITGWSYDAAGNLLNDGAHIYTYDAENKIRSVDTVVAYTYDGEGQRVRKLVGENLRFVYDISGRLIAEFSGSSGALKKEYLYGASGLAATIEPNGKLSNGTRYITSDHLSSPRVVTNFLGGVVSRHDYKPFGEELGSGIGGRTTGMGFIVNDGIRQKFTSYEKDSETSLDFAHSRFYSNQQGRFTTADPLMASAKATDPQSFNRYTYALNSPVTTTDPSGMLSMSMTSACGQFARNDESVNGVRGVGGAFSAGGLDKTLEIPEQEYIRGYNEMVAIFNELAEKAQIRVTGVELLGGWRDDSPVVGKGNPAPYDFADNPDNYILDITQGDTDPNSTFTVKITFSGWNTGNWDKDSMKVTAPKSGRWQLVETKTGEPAIRKDWGGDTVSVLLNVRARDVAAENKAISIQVSAYYTSLYRSDGRAGIDTPSITKKIALKLLIGKTTSTVRDVP